MFEEVARLRCEADARGLAHRLDDSGLKVKTEVRAVESNTRTSWGVLVESQASAQWLKNETFAALYWVATGFVWGLGDEGEVLLRRPT